LGVLAVPRLGLRPDGGAVRQLHVTGEPVLHTQVRSRSLSASFATFGRRARGSEFHCAIIACKLGDSLRRKIDAGIAKSRFGLVVLSTSFFAKGWPQYELDGLVTMSVSGKQVLLPIWHGVSKDEVMSQSPTLAGKVALRTSDYSIAEIAEEIASVVHPEADEQAGA